MTILHRKTRDGHPGKPRQSKPIIIDRLWVWEKKGKARARKMKTQKIPPLWHIICAWMWNILMPKEAIILLLEAVNTVHHSMNLVPEHVGPAPEPVVVWKTLDWSHGSDCNILKENRQ